MKSVIRSLLFAAVVTLLVVSKPATTLAQLEVAPGFDMWTTDPGTTSFIIPGLGDVNFQGIPIGDFDFGVPGIHDTGTTDTIVQRLEPAIGNVGDPLPAFIGIELVALQLRSVEPVGLGPEKDFLFVTLHDGLPQLGEMAIFFADANSGSYDLFFPDFAVDVRSGSLDGDIVASGYSLFPLALVPWVREPVQPSLQIDGVNKNLAGDMTTDHDMWTTSGVLPLIAVSNTAPPGTVGLTATVPEPSTAVLAALGLLGLLGFGRRRRRC